MTDTKKLYLRTGDKQTVYLKNVITDPSITVGIIQCTTILSMIRLDLREIMFYTIIP